MAAACDFDLLQHRVSNIWRLPAESREGLTAGPPYYISEPMKEYPDGQQREDGQSHLSVAVANELQLAKLLHATS